jgi:hypothetical protein
MAQSEAYRQGLAAEHTFISKMLVKGYDVLSPASPGAPYDLVLHRDGRFIKVQVKSTGYKESNRYKVNIAKGCKVKTRYNSSEVDVFAIYLEPEDLWYLIPFDSTGGVIKVALSAEGEGKYGRFLENWGVLSGVE